MGSTIDMSMDAVSSIHTSVSSSEMGRFGESSMVRTVSEDIEDVILTFIGWGHDIEEENKKLVNLNIAASVQWRVSCLFYCCHHASFRGLNA